MRQLRIALVVGTAMLLAVGHADAQVSIGITIGQPPPAPPVVRVPPMPGPEFVWVEGYWYPKGPHYKWHDGYWTRPPAAGAYWVEPYYYRGRYFEGYWESGRRHVKHDHGWDDDHDRDYRHGKHHKHDD